MKSFRFSSLLVAPLFAGALLSVSCNRQKDTIAKVYVIDQNNQRVLGATVRLIPEPSELTNKEVVPIRESSTNRSGEAIFIYNDVFKNGQAGVAVMKIEVEFGGVTATGIIKIDQETTSEKTVIIQD